MRSRSIVPSTFAALAFASLVSLAALAGGCVEPTQDEPGEEGQLTIPLTTPASGGIIYRLSNATFEVTGPGGVILLNGNADVPSVSTALPPGLTNVTLRPGWSLSKSSDGGGTFQGVSALLGSPNPYPLRVIANTATTVSFDFLIRNVNGMLTVRFGVDPKPRQIAGGMIVSAGTGELAPYAGKRLDFSIFFSLYQFSRFSDLDGSKTIRYYAGASAMEFYNEPFAVLSTVVAPAMAAGYFEYQITAKANGTQEFSGQYSGGSEPYPTIDFGPQLLTNQVALDPDGFPTDQYFIDVIPFALNYTNLSGTTTASGRFTLRHLLP